MKTGRYKWQQGQSADYSLHIQLAWSSRMSGFGSRLIVLGCLLFIGSVCYYVYLHPTKAKLDADNFIIQLDNDAVRGGLKSGRIERRSAEEIYEEKRALAYWPGGLGLLLIAIGWAARGSSPNDAKVVKVKGSADSDRTDIADG